MADYHDLVQALTWLLVNKLQNKSEYTRGLLGNGQGQVQVPGRDDYTYVRPDRFTTRVAEIFNKTVAGPDGLPVILGELPWSPGLTQVLSVDWETYLGVGWGENTPGIAKHGPTHEWRDAAPGVDAFNVYRRQMGELRCYPVGSGSASVYVSPYNFTHMESLKSWSGLPGLDLTNAIPASTGTARMALVYWDPCSGTSGWLGVATGTLGVDAEPEILNRPAAPAGTIPTAWVRLAGGQGDVTEFDIWDARPLWMPSLEFATGSCGIWAGIIPIGDPGDHFTGSTVESALDELGASGGGAPSGPAGGDLTGTYPNPLVVGIYGFPYGLETPAEGEVLMYTGSAWRPVSFIHDHSDDSQGGADLHALEEMEFDDPTELTIDAGGAITRTQVYHSVDTEADAATDNLDTINGGVTGDLLVIKAENSARTVVVRHDLGNIWLSGGENISLDDADDHLALIYDGTYWCDVGWSVVGSDRAWPDDSKLMIGTTEYDTLAAAAAAANINETIKAGPGAIPIGVAAITIPSGVDLIGTGKDVTIFQSTGTIGAINFQSSNRASNFTVESTTDTGATGTYAILIAGADVEFHNVRADTQNPTGAGYGWHWAWTTGKMVECEGYASGGGTHEALITSGGSVDLIIEGGEFEGDNQDIDAGAAGDSITLYGPILINGNIAATGTVQGSWSDGDGDSYLTQGKRLILDTNKDTSIRASTGDQIDFEVGNSDVLHLTGTALYSESSIFPDLGTTTLAEKLGDVYLGTAKDIYPDNDEYGLWNRKVNFLETPDEHWHQSGDDLAWTGWANYTGYASPPATITYGNSKLLVSHGSATRVFRYRSYINNSAYVMAFVNADNLSEVGVMLDDGSDTGDGQGADNFVRVFLEYPTANTNPNLATEYRTGGGAVTKATYLSLPPMDFYVALLRYGGGTRWTNWFAQIHFLGHVGSINLISTFVTGLAWTPSRHGLYGRITSASRSMNWDWFVERAT